MPLYHLRFYIILRTSKLQLQPLLTTIRWSQSLILALDSKPRVTAEIILIFALSLWGNLSTLPLIFKSCKRPYFKPFLAP